MAFITMEDAKASFNLFCCVYGIGTLSMPGNFSRAGPALGIVSMVFMAFANVYGATVICRVMLLAPTSVKTYGDLGEWVLGTRGRYLTVVVQMASCLIVPCVFLVLGGTLLDGLFPNAFSSTTWSVLMAVTVMPVCLVPTLKEGAGVAFADVIGIAVVVHGMCGHPSAPAPELHLQQVIRAFGSLALANGSGVVIPSIHRQHSDPKRMPRVVGVTIGTISVLFLVLASTAYSAVGCQISGYILWTIYPSSATGLTSLGFSPNWGAVVLAYLAMQVHITVAFSVILNPVFYLTERLVLGMHKRPVADVENNLLSYAEVSTPAEKPSPRSFSSVADTEKVQVGNAEAEAAEYHGANAIKYVGHFSALSDFVGASCITLNSTILPIVFLLKKKWGILPMWEKVAALAVVVVCFCLGCYVTVLTGEELFTPVDDDTEFPYCAPEYENVVYYNYTAAHEG
ncbi:hypothetical protein PHYSODRAFT_256330 [Phytophthora sojae]|uniref:Amino acid transporter transmembrane domain-containing protein n=1 Tax=Phytophthora sojae (strain P6497) TaxID=1094619 RepID=G4ZB29_PHYSP|nr:hypothetical protein PHYSODRAFT_256330 [Phytophthora sojae]EGZ21248.1 hypothetical protein PHYSODRAFT_256330 [Phytophthora sojae]|eukprot:XP_009523965.1 hypothetical protein PHYSODRAFT_256330 [Phytophthora sojae]